MSANDAQLDHYVAQHNQVVYDIDAITQLPPIHPANNSEIPNSSDTISRQAAIDLLKQMRKDGDMVPWEGKDVFARIRKLPAEPHWIPVTERLPNKEEKSYWVCLEDGGQCQCRWTNDVYGLGANEWSKWGWKKVDLPQYSKVVAYMLLPEPYKGVVTNGRD